MGNSPTRAEHRNEGFKTVMMMMMMMMEMIIDGNKCRHRHQFLAAHVKHQAKCTLAFRETSDKWSHCHINIIQHYNVMQLESENFSVISGNTKS